METENNIPSWEFEVIRQFTEFVDNQQDCPGEYIEAVNENFWDLID